MTGLVPLDIRNYMLFGGMEGDEFALHLFMYYTILRKMWRAERSQKKDAVDDHSKC